MDAQAVDLQGANSYSEGISFTERRQKHQAVVNTIDKALCSGTHNAWEIASIVFQRRLSRDERKMLAMAAIYALDLNEAQSCIYDALPSLEMPKPYSFSPISDAQMWAEVATDDVKEAYAGAAFLSMPPERQAVFIDLAQGVVK